MSLKIKDEETLKVTKIEKKNKAVIISKDIFIRLEYLGESSTNYLFESLKKNQFVLETLPCHLVKQE